MYACHHTCTRKCKPQLQLQCQEQSTCGSTTATCADGGCERCCSAHRWRRVLDGRRWRFGRLNMPAGKKEKIKNKTYVWRAAAARQRCDTLSLLRVPLLYLLLYESLQELVLADATTLPPACNICNREAELRISPMHMQLAAVECSGVGSPPSTMVVVAIDRPCSLLALGCMPVGSIEWGPVPALQSLLGPFTDDDPMLQEGALTRLDRAVHDAMRIWTNGVGHMMLACVLQVMAR
ncbi:hypothetical protein C0Q70_03344 [Pomacea canaliculata]|uniref:Uncharacterized protein n=1 Tax=Pomacea canaliculata TaxID=400727 RepID=A0A2T7PSF6_POMCA|nr:hypothetical protein C0Q70_03344 [Pomacea canaliculata]